MLISIFYMATECRKHNINNNTELKKGLTSEAAAKKRMKEREEGRKEKQHVSLDKESMTWDWQGLIEEAKTWAPDKVVNWQAVARQYRVHKASDPSTLAGNGGQIVRAVLEEAGIDTHFTNGNNCKTGTPRWRRSAKGTNSGIALPSPTALVDLERKKKKNFIRMALCVDLFLLFRER